MALCKFMTRVSNCILPYSPSISAAISGGAERSGTDA